MDKYFFLIENPIRVVLQYFFGSNSVTIRKEISDNSGRISVLLQVKTDDEICLLVDLYNSNSESEQFKTLHELGTIQLKFDANEYNH